MKVFLVSLLIASAYSGSACLQKNSVHLEWSFSDSSIDYTLTLTNKIFETCGWLSFGYYFPDVEDSYVDNNIIVLKEYVTDGNINNFTPANDVDTGGQNDIINSSYDPATMTHRWSKVLNTTDVNNRNDILLFEGLAIGMYDDCGTVENGQLISFGFTYAEFFNIVFDDASYNCGDFLSQDF